MEDLPSLEDFILPLLYPNTPCKCADSPESAEIWPYNAFTTAQPDHINPENKFRPLARQIAPLSHLPSVWPADSANPGGDARKRSTAGTSSATPN